MNSTSSLYANIDRRVGHVWGLILTQANQSSLRHGFVLDDWCDCTVASLRPFRLQPPHQHQGNISKGDEQ